MTDPAAGTAATASDPELDPELAAEQRHIDAAYARLDVMRRAAERVAEGYTEVTRGGTHQARLEREAAEAYTRRRLAGARHRRRARCASGASTSRRSSRARPTRTTSAGSRSPTTTSPRSSSTGAPRSPSRSTGRRRSSRWASPAAATSRPTAGALVGIDDEVFDADATAESGFTVVGEGALLAALDHERTGRMRDIVATIQAEQDEAIRADLAGILVVSGGPGTGKTAVALHRAAYLLYTHRKRLASQGVLLVGPSAIFLRYIDEVLPSLGEDDVTLATPAALKPRLRVRRHRVVGDRGGEGRRPHGQGHRRRHRRP